MTPLRVNRPVDLTWTARIESENKIDPKIARTTNFAEHLPKRLAINFVIVLLGIERAEIRFLLLATKFHKTDREVDHSCLIVTNTASIRFDRSQFDESMQNLFAVNVVDAGICSVRFYGFFRPCFCQQVR